MQDSLCVTFIFDDPLLFHFRKILYCLTSRLLCFFLGSVVSQRYLFISDTLLDIFTHLSVTAVFSLISPFLDKSYVVFLSFASYALTLKCQLLLKAVISSLLSENCHRFLMAPIIWKRENVSLKFKNHVYFLHHPFIPSQNISASCISSYHPFFKVDRIGLACFIYFFFHIFLVLQNCSTVKGRIITLDSHSLLLFFILQSLEIHMNL